MSKKLGLLSSISILVLVIMLETQSNVFVSANSATNSERWVIIEDIYKDQLKVEATDDKVWATLVQLYQNKSQRWIGGIVETYVNQWGFRFNPDTIIVAEVTIEAIQTTIKGISQNLDYWLGNMAVVSATVIEIHAPQPVGGIATPVNKLALLAPYLGLTFIILALLVATVVCAKHRRSQRKRFAPHEE